MKGGGGGDDSVFPAPTTNFRYSGYLSKLGEGRVAWKKRWFHVDGTTGWLYWWTKPDGKVLGAVPLLDQTILTVLPAPEFCFRVSWAQGSRFRDFRADSQQAHATWVRHINEEIATRSGRPVASTLSSAAPNPLTQSSSSALPLSSSSLPTAAPVTSSEDKERMKQLEAELLMLRQRVKELEAEAKEGHGGDDDEEDAEAAERMRKMQMQDGGLGGGGGGESEAALRDKVEDLTFQLNSCKKRLKAANETIKKQAQRIQLLEKGEK